MIRRLVSAAAATVMIVTAPFLLGPSPAAAEPRAGVRRIDTEKDRDGRHDQHRSDDHRHRKVITYFVPTYVVPAPTWVPGYWTWRWVPQAQTSYAYVPGYYDEYGVWVPSRYEPSTVGAGYYQQVWVDGYWQQ